MEGVRSDAEGLTLAVRLTPNAARDDLDGWRATADRSIHLAARVRAVPEHGKANKALVALLARRLGIPKRDVDVIRGATSRLKTVRIVAEAADQARLLVLLETTHER